MLNQFQRRGFGFDMVLASLNSNEHSISTSPMASEPHSPSSEPPLFVFKITTQINEKLTPSTFTQIRTQFEALLIEYDLMKFVSGTSKCPLPMTL